MALDWGDWDGDKDLDLALARSNGGARVYANISGAFFPLWEGAASVRATDVRFGDKDGDGDLDLAIARAGSGDSGFYENRSVSPVHLLTSAEAALLPVRSSYVQVQRPGVTRSAYLYSSSEILSGPNKPTVTVSYRLYDPEGVASDPPREYQMLFSYSLDGGDNWLPATPSAGQTDTVVATLTRTGTEFKFLWNAAADKAIAENASFRVEVVNKNGGPSVQKAAGAAASPPFQVRATTCIWPKDPRVFVDSKDVLTSGPYPLEQGKTYAELVFDSALAQGSGVMIFTWNFGDGSSPRNGQRVINRLPNGTYSVTLQAIGKPCPETRSARTTVTLVVGTGAADSFLPIVTKAPATSAAEAMAAAGITADRIAVDGAQIFLPTVVTTPMAATQAATQADAAEAAVATAAAVEVALPPAVAALDGTEENGRVRLTWQPPPPGSAAELQVLRWPLNDPAARTVETTLPPMVSRYDASQSCGVAYAVVPANGAGQAEIENVYLLQPCGGEVN